MAVIPADNTIPWNPGVVGGLPDVSTPDILATDSPHNAVGDGVTNNDAAFLSAAQAATAGQIVGWPAGTYKFTQGFDIREFVSPGYAPHIHKGDGMDLTIFDFDGVAGGLIQVGRGTSVGSDIAITSGLTKGTTALTLASVSGLSVGNFIYIKQDNPPGIGSGESQSGPNGNGTQFLTQHAKITDITSLVITIDRELYRTLDSDENPVVARVSLSEGWGFQGMHIRGDTSLGVEGRGAAENLVFTFTANSWCFDVKSTFCGESSIRMELSARNTIQRCWTDGNGNANDGSKNYGYDFFKSTSDFLVIDNVAVDARHGFIWQGGGYGHFVGYNKTAESIHNTRPPTIPEFDENFLPGTIEFHGANPVACLVEGNITEKLLFSSQSGLRSASNCTAYRNWFTAESTAQVATKTARIAVVIDQDNYDNALTGNILNTNGHAGANSFYEFNDDVTPEFTNIATLKFGATTAGSKVETDTAVEPSTIRHRNFDYITESINEDEPGFDLTLPDSLFFDEKPEWWGPRLKWPPFDPTDPGAAALDSTPAGWRYENGNDDYLLGGVKKGGRNAIIAALL